MSVFRFDVISGVSYSAGGRDLMDSCSPYLQLPILRQILESSLRNGNDQQARNFLPLA